MGWSSRKRGWREGCGTFSSIWSLAISKENQGSPWGKPRFFSGRPAMICTLPVFKNMRIRQSWTFPNSLHIACSLFLSWLLESLPAFQHRVPDSPLSVLEDSGQVAHSPERLFWPSIYTKCPGNFSEHTANCIFMHLPPAPACELLQGMEPPLLVCYCGASAGCLEGRGDSKHNIE